MKIARVFPRQTKATPDDNLCFLGLPQSDDLDVDEVHISIAFTYDKAIGEYMAQQWYRKGYKVKLGGPAYGEPAGEFIPGMYLKKGITITSRGCNNKCWFCRVHKTQGNLIELPIKDGSVIQDDNLLACSELHIRKVFEMLERQPERPKFPGGLEAKLLQPWHVELLQRVQPQQMFFAYDTEDDYEPLVRAGRLLREIGFDLRKRKNFAYVLIGYPEDTFEKAEKRLKATLAAGFIPFAMLYKSECGFEDPEWKPFQRAWCRPAAIVAKNKEFFKPNNRLIIHQITSQNVN